MPPYLVVVYWCPTCKLYHLDVVIEWENAEPYHRASDGTRHPVVKSKKPHVVH